MEELLKELSIQDIGTKVGEIYTITIDSYDEFSALYNKLEQSEVINKDSDESFFNLDEAHVVYLNDDFEVNLNADLNNDKYTFQVKEI